MPPESSDGQTAMHGQADGEEERAIVVIADGLVTAAAVDNTKAYVDRAPALLAVDVEHDDETGEGFARAVERRIQGDVQTVLLPSPDHLPKWIRFVEGDPRRKA